MNGTAPLPTTAPDLAVVIAEAIQSRYPKAGTVSVTFTSAGIRVSIDLVGGTLVTHPPVATRRGVMSHLWASYHDELITGEIR